MKILGVTGTSGSGKSTFSRILNERKDIEVIDADQVSRDLSVPGTKYLQDVVDAFGEEILLPDGNLNRRALAHIIYSDENERNKLNSITFPHIRREIYERIKAVATPEIKFAVIDAPLLFEASLDKVCDSVISLVANTELQVKRICKRDGISEETARARLATQKPISFYLENSDIVIQNTDNTDLRQEADKLIRKLTQGERDKTDESR